MVVWLIQEVALHHCEETLAAVAGELIDDGDNIFS